MDAAKELRTGSLRVCVRERRRCQGAKIGVLGEVTCDCQETIPSLKHLEEESTFCFHILFFTFGVDFFLVTGNWFCCGFTELSVIHRVTVYLQKGYYLKSFYDFPCRTASCSDRIVVIIVTQSVIHLYYLVLQYWDTDFFFQVRHFRI